MTAEDSSSTGDAWGVRGNWAEVCNNDFAWRKCILVHI